MAFEMASRMLWRPAIEILVFGLTVRRLSFSARHYARVVLRFLQKQRTMLDQFGSGIGNRGKLKRERQLGFMTKLVCGVQSLSSKTITRIGVGKNPLQGL